MKSSNQASRKSEDWTTSKGDRTHGHLRMRGSLTPDDNHTSHENTTVSDSSRLARLEKAAGMLSTMTTTLNKDLAQLSRRLDTLENLEMYQHSHSARSKTASKGMAGNRGTRPKSAPVSRSSSLDYEDTRCRASMWSLALSSCPPPSALDASGDNIHDNGYHHIHDVSHSAPFEDGGDSLVPNSSAVDIGVEKEIMKNLDTSSGQPLQDDLAQKHLAEDHAQEVQPRKECPATCDPCARTGPASLLAKTDAPQHFETTHDISLDCNLDASASARESSPADNSAEKNSAHVNHGGGNDVGGQRSRRPCAEALRVAYAERKYQAEESSGESERREEHDLGDVRSVVLDVDSATLECALDWIMRAARQQDAVWCARVTRAGASQYIALFYPFFLCA